MFITSLTSSLTTTPPASVTPSQLKPNSLRLIVAATSKPAFVFPVNLPLLRVRKEDLALLSTYFLQKIAKKLGKKLAGLSLASLQQMNAYHWPGNIREREHLLERAAIMSTTPEVSLVEPLAANLIPAPTPSQSVLLNLSTRPSETMFWRH